MEAENPPSEDAWKSYAETEGFLRRYVTHFVADKHHAEDVVQEAFLRMYEAARWTEIREPRAYLTRVAKNLIVDYWRSCSRLDRLVLASVYNDLETAVEQHENPSWDHDSADVRRTLCRLPWKHRRVLEMHYLEGKSYSEVAATMGTSVANVKVMSLRARRRVRASLDMAVTSSPIRPRQPLA